MLGQQSLAEFLGLHLDIEAIAKKNKENRTAKRKMGLIINTGDKLTTEDKKKKQAENQILYGLSDDYVRDLKLPASTEVKIFSVSKIVNAKVSLSTIEKIEHLLELERALKEKLEKVRDKKAKQKVQNRMDTQLNKLTEDRTSSIEEDYGEEEGSK